MVSDLLVALREVNEVSYAGRNGGCGTLQVVGLDTPILTKYTSGSSGSQAATGGPSFGRNIPEILLLGFLTL
jgi:hypothetical protein